MWGKMESKWHLEVSLKRQVESKRRLEASLKGQVESKWRLEASLRLQVKPKKLQMELKRHPRGSKLKSKSTLGRQDGENMNI